MGKCFQVMAGFATNPGAANTALTMATGDSLTLPVWDPSNRGLLVSEWCENAAGGVIRTRSPRFHDNTQGIRLQVPAGDDLWEFRPKVPQRLYPGDTITVDTTGGAAEVDVVCLAVYYENLPGIDAPLKSWAEIQDRIVNYVGLEVDLTSGATAGQWGGARTLQQDFTVLKADVSYAVLGYTPLSKFAALGITGPDTGKVRVGGPGSIHTEDTADWFVDLSDHIGLPCIPVIQALNAGATNIDLVATDTATAHHVSLLLAELSS